MKKKDRSIDPSQIEKLAKQKMSIETRNRAEMAGDGLRSRPISLTAEDLAAFDNEDDMDIEDMFAEDEDLGFNSILELDMSDRGVGGHNCMACGADNSYGAKICMICGDLIGGQGQAEHDFAVHRNRQTSREILTLDYQNLKAGQMAASDRTLDSLQAARTQALVKSRTKARIRKYLFFFLAVPAFLALSYFVLTTLSSMK